MLQAKSAHRADASLRSLTGLQPGQSLRDRDLKLVRAFQSALKLPAEHVRQPALIPLQPERTDQRVELHGIIEKRSQRRGLGELAHIFVTHAKCASRCASRFCRSLSKCVVFWRVSDGRLYARNGPTFLKFRPVFIGCGGSQPAVPAALERRGVTRMPVRHLSARETQAELGNISGIPRARSYLRHPWLLFGSADVDVRSG